MALWTPDAVDKGSLEYLLFQSIKHFAILKGLMAKVKVLLDGSANDIAALRRLLKVFIALDLFDAHPAKEYPAASTYHFVAPVYFLYGKSTAWALLCALLDVV